MRIGARFFHTLGAASFFANHRCHSREGGNPVRRGVSIRSQASLEYWIVRLADDDTESGARHALTFPRRLGFTPYPVGVPCFHWPPAIFAAAITACVRLSTPSFCRIAETCALMVASETPSS